MAARRSYGTGSLYAHADGHGVESWYGRWRSNGRRVNRRIGLKRAPGSRDGLTRTQAEARMRDLMGEVKVSAAVRQALTLSTVADRYQRHLKAQGRKRSTLTAVESACRVWLVPRLGDRTLDRVVAQDVEDLMATMSGANVGPKSIRNYIGTLSAIYRYAMDDRRRWATFNPCNSIDLPPVVETTEIRFLTVEEVEALAAAAVTGPYQQLDRAMYLTAAMTGLRQGELIALRWMDVDWTASRIRVRQNHVLGEFDTPKSRRGSRSVPMSSRVGGELDRLFKASSRQADDDLVFGDPLTGKPLARGALMRRYRRALTAALIPGFRFHDLRHTFGTRMAAAGVPMRTLQEWMGHRDIQTTQRYADYAPNAREVEMVEAAFGLSVHSSVQSEAISDDLR
jgi:integrase